MFREINDSKDRVVKTVCSLCYSCCGVFVHISNGKVVKIEGDPKHPNSKGKLCPKGMAGIELLYHPGRLNYPLKRIGKKGQGKWERISWDEALETIAKRLTEIKEQDGPESICIARGGGLYGNGGIIGYFAYLLGTPNTMSFGFICFHPHVAAVRATIGYPDAIQATEAVWDEVVDSRCILLWAANPQATAPYPVGDGIQEAREKGAKLIVVDPRPTELAKKADIWLQIRPATDDALALGMLHVIINENLYDLEFVNEYTYGFDKLKDHVQIYTPKKVSSITWISEEDIKTAARMFAGSRPACICQRVALDQNCNSIQTSRAIFILNSICGNLDAKGGNLLPASGKIMSDNKIFAYVNKLPRKVLEKRIGAKELPLLSGPESISKLVHPDLWADAILSEKPYPLRAQITSARNIVLADQDSAKAGEAYKKLEFSVTIDLFMTPTAELSDIVLPAASWLERDGLRGHPNYPYVTNVQHKVLEPLYERRDDIQIFIDLAKKMNLNIPWDTVSEYMDFKLQDTEFSFEELREVNYLRMPKVYNRHLKGKFEFKTPTKKVELYSTTLEKLGYDPLPRHMPPPELTSEFPLILMGGRKRIEYVHSTGRQIDSLRKRSKYPTIEMSPDTAKEWGILENDWTWVETVYFANKRRVRFKAKIVKDFLPKMVAVNHGWWFPEKEEGVSKCFESNVNYVIPGNVYDPTYGSTNIRSIPCRIYKC